MPSVNATVFHAYTYGTAFWYGLRGLCRVYDPVMVAGCMLPIPPLPPSPRLSPQIQHHRHRSNEPPGFRPPSQLNLAPNDLELYNIRNDGWCLVTLALILISFTNAVPFASPGTAKSQSQYPNTVTYAKAVVAATVFHHVTTGIGAYQHYKLDTHYNTSMSIGVWGNVWLTFTGLLTWGLLQSRAGERDVEVVAKKVR
ncbi:hypothetical protein T440DRAFT_30044 [Plenodomus tracheiphilus IPT5]|uniref:Uncharacterized protein n=1 Tax=Plenodomus tracheiphilus IPT5 TaxID=1408161 RepID=A0A6A7BAY4_9PLEO|nr:hypothetical protein T440DRAFT_30044 [Plenodomus tracheiphilus IPT5]